MDKIEIMSTHNFFCPKFAVVCRNSARNFQPRLLLITQHDTTGEYDILWYIKQSASHSMHGLTIANYRWIH